MNCKYCNGSCIKKGFYQSNQRFLCKSCFKYQQESYVYSSCTKAHEIMIVKLNNVGVGISGIARVTQLSKATVIRKIKEIARKIVKPLITEVQQEYEVDEMHTFIGRKDPGHYIYIIYAINRRTKTVIDFRLGKRTKENIGELINELKTLRPSKIFTDKLNVYPGLIGNALHKASVYQINHIERFNLTLRTHLKRLSRKTICFSRSAEMLENCLRLYLWEKEIHIRS
jgi:insertion element IS1 protein InsB